jgi:hypothetical protein
MPGYSEKAQSYLDAIAESVFTLQEVRNWLIKGTLIEPSYVGSREVSAVVEVVTSRADERSVIRRRPALRYGLKALRFSTL